MYLAVNPHDLNTDVVYNLDSAVEQVDTKNHKVFVFHMNTEVGTRLPLSLSLPNGVKYHLCIVARKWDRPHNCGWDAEVYSRHSGSFSGWWYQRRFDKIARHSSLFTTPICGTTYLLAYTWERIRDLQSLGTEFLIYIGVRTMFNAPFTDFL